MILVPLPLFATLLLALGLIHFVSSREMAVTANRLFAALGTLYAVQSLLLTLRWGYGIEALGPVLLALAPVLPALAWLAFRALAGAPLRRALMPVAFVPVAWGAQAVGLGDAAVTAMFLGFGAALLATTAKGSDTLSLAPFGSARLGQTAMAATGIGLIGAAVMDILVIADFVLAEGRHVGMAVSVTQVGFVLALGLASLAGRASTDPADLAPPQDPVKPAASDEACEGIVKRVTDLFETDALHRDEDLSLRRLARRLGLPDRQVSSAINRCHGMSVSRFVNEYRIRDACEMLRDTDLSILQISLMVGFSTKSNFNREFARVTGTNPSGWRAR